jgi:hypothetical protein
MMTSRVVLERNHRLITSAQSLSDESETLEMQQSANMASMSIAATRWSPRPAAALANAVGTAYERVSEGRSGEQVSRGIACLEKLLGLQAELDSSPKPPDGRMTVLEWLAGQIADLKQWEQDIPVRAEMYTFGVEKFPRAERPDALRQPKPKLAAASGALHGLLVTRAWACWSAARNKCAERRGDPARILCALPLGEVPRLRARQRAVDTAISSPPVPDLSTADACHFVVASLKHELHLSLGGLRVVLGRVAFVKTPLIGDVFLRPRGLGVRALWVRITCGLESGAGRGTVAADPEQQA